MFTTNEVQQFNTELRSFLPHFKVAVERDSSSYTHAIDASAESIEILGSNGSIAAASPIARFRRSNRLWEAEVHIRSKWGSLGAGFQTLKEALDAVDASQVY